MKKSIMYALLAIVSASTLQAYALDSNHASTSKAKEAKEAKEQNSNRMVLETSEMNKKERGIGSSTRSMMIKKSEHEEEASSSNKMPMKKLSVPPAPSLDWKLDAHNKAEIKKVSSRRSTTTKMISHTKKLDSNATENKTTAN